MKYSTSHLFRKLCSCALISITKVLISLIFAGTIGFSSFLTRFTVNVQSWHSNHPVFPGSLPFFGARSPGFWNNSKIIFQVIEAHVGFSDACGNGLINLSFVPKPKSFFDRGWRSVSFRNSHPQSSFRVPSSRPVVFAKEIVATVCWVYLGENLPVFQLQRLECLSKSKHEILKTNELPF